MCFSNCFLELQFKTSNSNHYVRLVDNVLSATKWGFMCRKEVNL